MTIIIIYKTIIHFDYCLSVLYLLDSNVQKELQILQSVSAKSGKLIFDSKNVIVVLILFVDDFCIRLFETPAKFGKLYEAVGTIPINVI